MALTVEDGTGLANADSFASLEAFNAYLADFGYTTDATDAAKEVALRKASQFIDTGWIFYGQKLRLAQALAWPRWGAEDRDGYDILSDVVPSAVVEATCELAFHALTSSFDRDANAANVKREKIGEIETEYSGSAGTVRPFAVAERILSKVNGRRRANSARVVRA